MLSPNSKFLIEIGVEDLISYIDDKEFTIQCGFADIFNLYLKGPNDLTHSSSQVSNERKKSKLKYNTQNERPPSQSHNSKKQLNISKSNEPRAKVRNVNKNKQLKEGSQNDIQKISSRKKLLPIGPETRKNLRDPKNAVDPCQFIFNGSIDTLKSYMEKYALEVSIWKKNEPYKLGSTRIPWSPIYKNFLKHLPAKQNLAPVFVNKGYNVFDEFTSRRMATIKLHIKLTYLKEELPAQNITIQKPSTIFDSNENTLDQDAIGSLKTYYRKKSEPLKKHIMQPLNSKLTSQASTIDRYDSSIDYTRLKSRLFVIRSDTNLCPQKDRVFITKSNSSVDLKYNIMKYNNINPQNPFLSSDVYCVGYCSYNMDAICFNALNVAVTEKYENEKPNLMIGSCPCRPDNDENDAVVGELNNAAVPCMLKPCTQVHCADRKPLAAPNSLQRIILDIENLDKKCCDNPELKTIKSYTGQNYEQNAEIPSCLCSCTCVINFIRKTTYCNICGGYQNIGQDMPKRDEAVPCPIYHSLSAKKPASSSGSESKKRRKKSNAASVATQKSRDNIHDPRFIFHYGFTNIPCKIGHNYCRAPCTGTRRRVPAKMGWLWTDKHVIGLKFRPDWRPGAANKFVVRMLRMAKNPHDPIFSGKKKREVKKPVNRPLLVVKKKEGEYTVALERMKAYPENKPRTVNQQPFDDKPSIVYTVGRTEEENSERKRKKERAQRNLEKQRRAYIQSAFKDVCKDICVKTYEQALGILPGGEFPDCSCAPAKLTGTQLDLLASCTCSDEESLGESDTDSDEWMVEFNPPVANYNPKTKIRKVLMQDNTTQYSYLDYKVTLYDSHGRLVPRFFKGLDGSQICSDLGGFWAPDGRWQEINVDGIVGQDGRWAPFKFVGPGGDFLEVNRAGSFTIGQDRFYLGVDGYVDSNLHWKFYPGKKTSQTSKQQPVIKKEGGQEKTNAVKDTNTDTETRWSCFGDASVHDLSKMGILGHGHDKKTLLQAYRQLAASGEAVKFPQQQTVPRLPARLRARALAKNALIRTRLLERGKCEHREPSEKGILAVNDRGNKVYFKLRQYKNKRPKERLDTLAHQGISITSFHIPCLDSFIGIENMKQKLREKLEARYGTNEYGVSVQAENPTNRRFRSNI